MIFIKLQIKDNFGSERVSFFHSYSIWREFKSVKWSHTSLARNVKTDVTANISLCQLSFRFEWMHMIYSISKVSQNFKGLLFPVALISHGIVLHSDFKEFSSLIGHFGGSLKLEGWFGLQIDRNICIQLCIQTFFNVLVFTLYLIKNLTKHYFRNNDIKNSAFSENYLRTWFWFKSGHWALNQSSTNRTES